MKALDVWHSDPGKTDEHTDWSRLSYDQSQNGQWPQARFSLEKARLRVIYSHSLENRIVQLEDRMGLSSSSGMDYLWSFGPEKVWLIAIILALPLLFGACQCVERRLRGALFILALIPLSIGWWFHGTSAAVTEIPIEVFDGPSTVFRTGRMLPAGAKVWMRAEDEWWHIIGPEWASGWLPRERVLPVMWLWGGV